VLVIWLVVAVGVVGIGLLVWYCIKLTRKVTDLAGEVAVLAERGEQLAVLLEQVEIGRDSVLTASRTAFDSEPDVR
jgi:hypothetical protein